MIINKRTEKVIGYIEYSYTPKINEMFYSEISQDDLDSMFETDTFSSLEELIEKLKPNVLEKIKEDYDAEDVYISCISFRSKSEDRKTSSEISMFENGKSNGYISTKINNDDIDSRLMLNLQQVKQIIDNTLEQYPIKY